jgi:hypothetical protein
MGFTALHPLSVHVNLVLSLDLQLQDCCETLPMHRKQLPLNPYSTSPSEEADRLHDLANGEPRRMQAYRKYRLCENLAMLLHGLALFELLLQQEKPQNGDHCQEEEGVFYGLMDLGGEPPTKAKARAFLMLRSSWRMASSTLS